MGKFMQLIALWILGKTNETGDWKITIDSPDFKLKAETRDPYDNDLREYDECDEEANEEEEDSDNYYTSLIYTGESVEEIKDFLDEACADFEPSSKPQIIKSADYSESVPVLILKQGSHIEFVNIGDMIVVWAGRVMLYKVDAAKDMKVGTGAKYYICHHLEAKKKGWNEE